LSVYIFWLSVQIFWLEINCTAIRYAETHFLKVENNNKKPTSSLKGVKETAELEIWQVVSHNGE
jgi:hypothetical protein